MMKQTLIASAVASAFLMTAAPAIAEEAPAPAPSPLTFNVGVVSDYLFRGVSQTHGDPAVSAGVDYAFSNGFYIGAWASTITWVEDWLGDGNVEVDFYGGYKGAFADSGFTYDLGAIRYQYPGAGDEIPTFLADPNTTELYAAVSYKWLTLKYSHAISKHFIGWYGGSGYDQETKGSNYIELNAVYDLGDGWGLTGHVGHQKVKNSVSTPAINDANYTDWKLGVTKDVGFGVVGLAYSDTDADGGCGNPPPASGASAYCWGELQSKSPVTYDHFDNVAEGTFVLSFTKTF